MRNPDAVTVPRWLVIRNGCNECSELSAIVGAYVDREAAQSVSAERFRTDDTNSYTYPVFDLLDMGEQLPWAEDEERARRQEIH